VKRGKFDGNQDGDDCTKDRPRAATSTEEEDGAALDEQTIPPGNFTLPNHSADQAKSGDNLPFELPDFEYLNGQKIGNDELIDLSMSESLPPLEVIEEL